MRFRVDTDGWMMLCAMIFCDRGSLAVAVMLAAALHELGHVFAASALGIRIRELRLGFSGARLYPEEQCISYRKEIFLCLAGPLVSLSVAAISLGVPFAVCGDGEELSEKIQSLLSGEQATAIAFLGLIGIIALLQGILNLLPIESLDGGRVLYAVVSSQLGMRAADAIRKTLTCIAAVMLWLFSTYLLLRTGSGIGVFFCAICIFARAVLLRDNSNNVLKRQK